MRTLLLACILLTASLLVSGCVTTDDSDGDVDVGPRQAAILTSKGTILIEFYCDAAPNTVANFRQYAQDDFYQGTIFHRIIEDFMIQGGGFTEDGTQKQTRAPVALEYERPNERGTIAMARTPDPNSATSQFFINTADNSQSLGPGPNGPGYTVFGRVVEGMGVVDEIAAVPVENQNPSDPRSEMSKPVDPPVINDVTVGEGCAAEPAEEPTYGVELGLIHNTMDEGGVWHANVSAATDYVPFYILNTGNQEDTFNAQVESPASWDITVEEGTYRLSKNTDGQGSTYPYAAAGYLIVRPIGGFENATDGNVTLTFTSEDSPDTKATLQIRLEVGSKEYSRVSKPGDSVTLAYTGSFDGGEEFDSGEFSTTVGSSQTVTGFSNGMMGLHLGETVDIRFPPELGYGYSQTGSREQFNGEWLNFELTLKQLG